MTEQKLKGFELDQFSIPLKRYSPSWQERLERIAREHWLKEQERRMIDTLKAHLMKAFIKNEKWKIYRPQFSLEIEDSNESLIIRMLELRKKRMLSKVYELVFEYNISHELVYRALCELVPRLRMRPQLEQCLHNSVTMMLYAMYEHSENKQVLWCPKQVLSKLNSSDYLKQTKNEYVHFEEARHPKTFNERLAIELRDIQNTASKKSIDKKRKTQPARIR